MIWVQRTLRPRCVQMFVMETQLDVLDDPPFISMKPRHVGVCRPSSSRRQGAASKWMERAEAMCTDVVRDKLAPEIATAVGASLAKSDGPWLTFEVDASSHSPVLLFHYPTTQHPPWST